SLKTSIKTITYLSDIGCLEIHGASLMGLPQKKNFSTRCTMHSENSLPTEKKISGYKSTLKYHQMQNVLWTD
ncbi:hypothetical protein OS104_19950, partial [Escherichia coli]